MKSLKIFSLILSIILATTCLAGCESISFLKPEESTTKKAFNQEAFDEEYYRTSVANEEEKVTETSEESTTEDDTSSTEVETTAKKESSTSLTEKITEITSVISTTAAKTTTTKKASKLFATTTKKTVTDTKREEKKTKTDYKYGVIKVDIVATYYDIYSDGSKVQTDKKSYTTYDYSKFSATTKDLLSEAKSNKTKYSSDINSVVSAINNYRKDAGKSELTLDDNLSTAASVRATEMAYSAKLKSTRPDGSKYSTVLSDLNIEYTSAIELTAKNCTDGSSAASAWKKQSSSTVTNSDYKKIGVGIAEGPEGDTYWCVMFTN